MTRVLLVDDDFLARMYLRQLIDWEQAGCALVGDAANGQQALDSIAALQPEIILTDISMPVMDGVELIRRLKEQGCTARIAVLSCHDEFSYVKEAMRLGADEYILKNTLDADGLRTLLHTLKEGLMRQGEAQSEQQRLLDLAAQGSRSVLQGMLTALCEGPLPQAEQQALLQKSGVSLSFYQCAALIVHPGAPVLAACARYAEAHGAICIEALDGDAVLLLDLTGLSSAREQHEVLQRFMSGLTALLEETAALAVSPVCTGDGALSRALSEAGAALGYSFYGKRLCLADELPRLADTLPEAAREVLRLARLPGCDAARLLPRFKDAADALSAQPASPHAVRAWVRALDEALLAPDAMPPQSLADVRARAAYYRRFLDERAQLGALQAANPAVAQAVSYIRAHFAEPISLAQVAEEVGLNPAYLSFVFKRDSGVNFSDFLLSCRLEAVKRLLRETNLAIKDAAAQAGFLDYRHFTKLFKKETGLRPADFRKQA